MMSSPAAAVQDVLLDAVSRRYGLPRAALAPEQDLFETLGIDSVEALELLTELEDRFGVELPDYELRAVRSFASLAALLERRRGA